MGHAGDAARDCAPRRAVSRRRVAALVALGAIALAASYPPFSLPGISFVALVPLLVLLRRAAADHAPRRAFAWGFWYGTAAHGAALYWLVVALWRFTPLSALGYAATVLIIGLWVGALSALTVGVRQRAPGVPMWVVFPLGWTAVEWVIGHQGDIAFPWLGLGTSLTETPALVQWADLAGARGVTLWLAWCSAMVVEAGSRVAAPAGRRAIRASVPYLAAVAASVALALGYGAWRVPRVPLRPAGVVGMIQPNEGFQEKWNKQRADSIVATLVALSDALDRRADPSLYVWPEAALPGYLQRQPDWAETIGAFARRIRKPILTGGLWARFYPSGDYDYYNAVLYVDSAGQWSRYPIYGKHYLVPVVERVPFLPPSWFGRLRFFGGFSRGTTLPLYETPVGSLGVLICYESAFEDLPRRYRALGAELLVNVTNDAWFGRTSAPYQHAAHLVMRAIETRMGVARAANSGISEYVDPLGRRTRSTKIETQAVLADTVWTSNVRTPYTRLGDWVGRVAVLVTLALGAMLVVLGWRAGRR